MSYILEALKKSQRDRELGQVPTLDSQSYSESPAPRSSATPWIIIAFLTTFIAVAVAILFIFFRPPMQVEAIANAKPAPATEPSENTRTPSSIVPTTTNPQPNAKQIAATPSIPIVKTVPPVRQNPPKATKRLVNESPSETATPVATPVESSRANELEQMKQRYQQMLAEQKPPPKETVAPETQALTQDKVKRYPTTRELPAEIFEQLPPFNILMYYFDEDPSQRFIILNSNKLQEDDRTAEGLLIKEIRKDGLLLIFKDHRFFHSR